MKIAVLMGGTSAERDVSLATGREITRALRAQGHDVVAIDTANGQLLEAAGTHAQTSGEIGRTPPAMDALDHLSGGQLARRLDDLRAELTPEVVFIALHGGAGEDGHLQAVLDLIGTPYTGSGSLGSALAMDKLVSKQLFTSAGIPTPPWLVAAVEAAEVERVLGGFPVVVKPSHEGSTVGVSVVRSAAELAAALERAGRFSGLPLVEKFIPGRELAVAVLGGEALPIVEIRPSHDIYDYECKYTKGMTQYEVPAPLSAQITEEVQSLAVRAHRLLRLAGYSRVDFRLDQRSRPWCLEANSLPGMTATSLLPKAAAATGLSFEQLCERIVRLAVAPRDDGNSLDAGG